MQKTLCKYNNDGQCGVEYPSEFYKCAFSAGGICTYYGEEPIFHGGKLTKESILNIIKTAEEGWWKTVELEFEDKERNITYKTMGYAKKSSRFIYVSAPGGYITKLVELLFEEE